MKGFNSQIHKDRTISMARKIEKIGFIFLLVGDEGLAPSEARSEPCFLSFLLQQKMVGQN